MWLSFRLERSGMPPHGGSVGGISAGDSSNGTASHEMTTLWAAVFSQKTGKTGMTTN